LKRPNAFALLIAAGLVCLVNTTRQTSVNGAESATKPVNFNRDILPILSDNCFACHGPDEKQLMANLRLDTKNDLFTERNGYHIIVPGKSAESKLYQKVSSADPAVRMPPVYSNRTLKPEQIDLIRRWIDEGAHYETHWAFVAPKRPAVPEVKNKGWVRNPVDNFILARLESEGLKPSPEADKTTLLRRVTFDLTGLPPTPAELESFLADSSPGAYEKRVDQLLASPHYGERMAMPWLDLARYSDTHGYHIDSLRQMWHWRDWVINAYNRNMPFDEFTIEQLAGDLLPNPTVEQKIATGFDRNHMLNFEGGAIPEEYHVEYVVDRVSTTASTWLGLTMGCARCHDHKYDPVKQKDFYRFFAFFNTVPERGLDGARGNAVPVLELPSPEQQRERDELNRQIAQTLDAIPEKDVLALENQWREKRAVSMPAPPQQGLLAHYEFEGNLKDTSGHGDDAKAARGDVVYDDGVVGKSAELSGETRVDFGKAGCFDRNQPFTVAFWAEANPNVQGAEGIKFFQKRDDSPHWRGYEVSFEEPQYTDNNRRAGRIVVRLAAAWPDNAIEVETAERVLETGKPVFLTPSHHVLIAYDGSGHASGVKIYVDGKLAPGKAVKDNLTAGFRTDSPLRIGDKNIGRPFKGKIDDLRIYDRALTGDEAENLAVQLPARSLLAELAGKPVEEIESLKPEKPPPEAEIGSTEKAESKEQKAAKLLKQQQARLSEYFLVVEAPEQYRKLYVQLKDLREKKGELDKSIPNAMVMAEQTKPRDTFVLGRGQYENPGEKVTPGVPAFLKTPLLPDPAPNRLTLARWLVDPRNPLTARVVVNRDWQNYFGTGIVKTAEDFGSQGEPPSHPELLDWLATEFIRTGWNVKAMQRLIVTSATYLQSSRVIPELAERDPENRLLARGPRFRLPAEMVRDNALAASGLLNLQIGGPSVYPYQPKGLWEEMALGQGFSGQTYKHGAGADLYRRSMYTVWKRTVPPPSLTTFDAPDREKCVARRSTTNTPLQALVLLNDPTYVEASRVIAQKAILEAGADPAKRVDFEFRLVTDRNPNLQEQQVLLQLAQAELADYRRDSAGAAKLIHVGESKCAANIDSAELAAWTTVASTILNLDETITKE
jgi:hypothetical protein